MNEGQAQGDGDRREGSDSIPFLEWAVAALGLALVVATVGFLALEATGGPKRPPDVAVRVSSVARLSKGFLVRFTAVNRGDETAAAVAVEGELSRAGRPVETSQASLDYLPAHSERAGGLFFREDPRRGKLELRPLGYEAP